MSRPFALVTLALTATMAFMIGLIVAGSAVPAPALSHTQSKNTAAPSVAPAVEGITNRQAAGHVNFADVAERINPAVVNIEATTRAGDSGRRRRSLPDSGPFDDQSMSGVPALRPQSGSGFVIERNGLI